MGRAYLDRRLAIVAADSDQLELADELALLLELAAELNAWLVSWGR